MLQSLAECYRVLQSITEYCIVVQSATECYRVLQSVTESCRVFLSVTECYRVFLAHILRPIFGLVILLFVVWCLFGGAVVTKCHIFSGRSSS